MNIDDILKQYDLDQRLDTFNVIETNPWYWPLEQSLSRICQHFSRTPARFTFIKNREVQAHALYQHNLVVMTTGMFDALCHVAAKVVSSGAFVDFEGGVSPKWSPAPDFYMPSIASDLSRKKFNWTLESIDRIESGERQALFFYLLQTLVNFVALHELGHIHHNHGARFLNQDFSHMDVDLAKPVLLTPQEGVEAQAREVVADHFAFLRMQNILEHDLKAKEDTELMMLFAKKVLQGEKEKTRFLLTIVYLYFHMMDRHDWHAVDAFRLTHPPAPFRLKFLFGSTLERGVSGFQEEDIAEMLGEQHYACNALVSLVYNHPPTLDMFQRVGEPHFNDLHEAIYLEIPKWVNID
ncbi:hypothetical protein [Pseudomonas putida]|uniref:hypothetical protein n=1 Tax=Pseudomonas putida TaxID=303 RepID=UPI0018D708B8|nr:hypothetical protein [Pseudomonas putida]MBH3459002.1 hypothetical protein [Pseudomonas putida]